MKILEQSGWEKEIVVAVLRFKGVFTTKSELCLAYGFRSYKIKPEEYESHEIEIVEPNQTQKTIIKGAVGFVLAGPIGLLATAIPNANDIYVTINFTNNRMIKLKVSDTDLKRLDKDYFKPNEGTKTEAA